MPKFTDIKPGDALPERRYVPTNVSLFLYNAAIWNAHRIHYDEIYTKEVEKHPAVVVDGPLQGDWLTQAVLNWLGDDGELVEFEYSNRRAGYIGNTMVSGGKVESVDPEKKQAEFSLYVKVEGGDITAPGRAVVRFYA
jgi:hydroxyacyl-ACP dehydratase HTD2-like protein with hotdog domain|tara:strand:- start:921 stop:1334 length:414 start_codon:yes stop_codon:yes gene_type:complete